MQALWRSIIEEACPLPLSDDEVTLLYHRAASAYAYGDQFYLQMGAEPIELTKLFEQYRMLLKLYRGPDNAEETN